MRIASHPIKSSLLLLASVILVISSHTQQLLSSNVASEVLTWKGQQWNITSGSMAGIAKGSTSNVFVDQNGYLHLKITKQHRTVTAAEVFSKNNYGFGTYQWQIQGRIDHMNPAIVLGLFLYGPKHKVGSDGENELDIEFSKWRKTLCRGKCNADVAIYPTIVGLGRGEDDFHLKLRHNAFTTARLEWTSNRVTAIIMRGLQPIGKKKDVIETWTFAPHDYRVRIPQQPLPIGMNLWCSKKASSRNQEVVVQDFRFVPEEVQSSMK